MRAEIQYGSQRLELQAPEGVLRLVHRQPADPSIDDPAAAVESALEQPIGFPALRRALTPDDHVAIVVDNELPDIHRLLLPLLQHIVSAHVRPGAVTLVHAQPPHANELRDFWPKEFHEIRSVVHDPTDRRQLSYLATTRKGRRIYLNRTVVDSDQAIVLAGRRFDPLLGYSGAEGALYPALSDRETHKELVGRLSMAVPYEKPWPTRREAAEVAWLLGAPFMIQCIGGTGTSLCHVLAGTAESSDEGVRKLNARWRVELDEPADLVIAGVEGQHGQIEFDSIAAALAAASRVVKAGGRIVLLSAMDPEMSPAAELLRESESPAQALRRIKEGTEFDPRAAFCWASAAQRASLYLLSRLPQEQSEELFTIPLDRAGQVEKLLAAAPSCIILPAADKSMAVLRSSNPL
jgi:nickel-dependent lactate racemase